MDVTKADLPTSENHEISKINLGRPWDSGSKPWDNSLQSTMDEGVLSYYMHRLTPQKYLSFMKCSKTKEFEINVHMLSLLNTSVQP